MNYDLYLDTSFHSLLVFQKYWCVSVRVQPSGLKLAQPIPILKCALHAEVTMFPVRNKYHKNTLMELGYWYFLTLLNVVPYIVEYILFKLL